MKILVANLGSTSFKYRLFDMDDTREEVLAKGGYERVTDYGEVIKDCLDKMVRDGALESAASLDAVGFKTVQGKDVSGCLSDDAKVLGALEASRDLAPAHNPPYAAGIRQFAATCPKVPRVALFETAFYQWMPEAAKRYAVPANWHAQGIRRYGFHGASHKFIAERSAELLGREDVAEQVRNLYVKGPQPIDGPPLRVISCHLGGSSSVTGMRNGVAIGTSMGLSPQSGVPQNNRVGDLDSAALPYAMKTLGLSLEEADRQLTKAGGLLGLSGGVSGDLRDLKESSGQGNADAQLAIDVLVHEVRRYIGGYLLELNGIDALVFTAGIAENNPDLRAAICAELDSFGIRLDEPANLNAKGVEAVISAADAPVKVMVIPANEELIVAREARRLLGAREGA